MPRAQVIFTYRLFVFSLAAYYILDKLGIEVEDYYASEIDHDALLVANANFPTKIKQLGDITNMILDNIMEEIGPIDLLIGGSPCNDLSGVNANRKGLMSKK